MKIGQTLAKIRPLDSSFFRPRSLEESPFGVFYLGVCKQAVIKKIPVQNQSRQPHEYKAPRLVQPISQPNLAGCTLDKEIDRVFFVLGGKITIYRHKNGPLIWR